MGYASSLPRIMGIYLDPTAEVLAAKFLAVVEEAEVQVEVWAAEVILARNLVSGFMAISKGGFQVIFQLSQVVISVAAVCRPRQS